MVWISLFGIVAVVAVALSVAAIVVQAIGEGESIRG